MKTIGVAGAAAVLGAGLVFIMMRANRPEPVVQTVQTVPAVEATPPAPTPVAEVPTVTPEPERTPVSKPRPRKEPVRQARSQPPTTPVKTVETPAPAPSAPVQTTPPPSTPAPAPVEEPKPVVEEKKPVRVPQTVTIPSGTLLSIRVDQALSTKDNQTGDSFRATLDQPVVIDGFVIAERGARVEGRVVESDPGGRVKGVSRLSLELVRLNTADGQRLRLQTEPFAKQAEQEKKRDALKIGAAAGLGAAIGAIAGGGKGAAIGAGVGGAAGAGGVAATRGASAQVPAETRMTFRLRDAITVTEKLP
jgi:hypothetical protein